MRARDNPFATARLHQVRFRFPDGLTWPSFLQRLEQHHFRGALVGPEGSGKTALLEQMQAPLAGHGFESCWLRTPPRHTSLAQCLSPSAKTARASSTELDFWAALPQLTSRHIILLDSAEQLTGRDWRRFLRLSAPAAGLIITTHRPGRLPTLLECATSLPLLQSIVAELLGDTRSAENLPLPRLFQKHSGNIRLALLELYDSYASLERYSKPRIDANAHEYL